MLDNLNARFILTQDGVDPINVQVGTNRIAISQGVATITVPAVGKNVQALVDALISCDQAVGRNRKSQQLFAKLPPKKEG